MGNLCKGYVVNPWSFTSVVKIGSVQLRMVGKVCNICRVLETDISVMLMVNSSIGILFD
jgi:hypothetical protein